jgi:hypothetical protein
LNKLVDRINCIYWTIRRGFKIKLGLNSVKALFHKFANFERFFCCAGYMSGYKQKYAGRIGSTKKRKFEGKEKLLIRTMTD